MSIARAAAVAQLHLSCCTVHGPLLRKSAPAPSRSDTASAVRARARRGMARSNIDLARRRCEATSHHAGPARHRGANQAEHSGRLIHFDPCIWGSLLLLATAALPYIHRNGFERPTSRAPGFPAILAVIL